MGAPLQFEDNNGKIFSLPETPARVVSLSPEITEILFKIGAEKNIIAITKHDTHYSESFKKKIVGSFLSPNLNLIAQEKPDLIFVHSEQTKVKQKFNGKVKFIELNTHSTQKLYSTIKLLGNIFKREKEASQLIEKIKTDFLNLSQKVAKIPQNKRKRVIRIMGKNKLIVPGDDSFMNDIIRKAGGIAPKFNKTGNKVIIDKEEWKKFNPQVIYACDSDKTLHQELFKRPGWKDVEAVKNNKIIYYPCSLACRYSTSVAYFASWVTADIYQKEFFDPANQIIKHQVAKRKKIELDLNYVKKAEVVDHYLYDVPSNSLEISLTAPMKIFSTLVGAKKNITTIGNSYNPPQTWGFSYQHSFDKYSDSLYEILKKKPEHSCFLFTGVNMKDLAVVKKSYKNLTVYVLATAGTEGNAMKAGADEGLYYQPGTINILVLTNKKLTERAMARSIISVTEGKCAAVKDLDIRSTYSPIENQATGTGTDNILIVEGKGQSIDYAGGHSKIGELISGGAYQAVKESLFKHGGIYAGHSIFARLKTANISLERLISNIDCTYYISKNDQLAKLEELLLQPRYSGFIKSGLALSDSYEQGLIDDISSFTTLAEIMAEEIAGHSIDTMNDYLKKQKLPLVIKTCLNAVFNGVYQK